MDHTKAWHCLFFTTLLWASIEADPEIRDVDCFNNYDEGMWSSRGNVVEDVSTIPDVVKRSPNNTITSSDVSLNDKTLTPGWYGEPGSTLINYPPGVNRCGTRYPIWKANEDTMCIQTETDVCFQSFKTRRFDCMNYDAFHLLQPEMDDASYCFDSVPNLNYGVFVTQPVINVGLEHETNHSSLVFKCNFIRSSEYLYYTTRWFVTKIIKDSGPVEWADDSFTYIEHTAITEDMLISGGVEKAGFNIMCVVSATRHPGSFPAKINWSEKKFVGVEVSRTVVYLQEGESKSIKARLSVPFGCGVQNPICNFNIGIVNSHLVKNNCTVVVLKTDMLTTRAVDWNNWTTFEVVGKRTMNSLYGWSSYTRSKIMLKTTNNDPHLSPLWQNYDIGTIRTEVKRKTQNFHQHWCWEGLDPNFLTFNSRRVSFGHIGVFTMYKAEMGAIEVQIETEECGIGFSCNCGLVVRAGRTVFEINRCQSNYWFADYTACGDGNNILRVLRNWNEYNLKLYTALEVRVVLSNTMRVTITTSEFTDEGSEGLCGPIPGPRPECDPDYDPECDPVTDPSDFKMRSGGLTSSVGEFVESWRVEDSQNLFNPEVLANGFAPASVVDFCIDDWYWDSWKRVSANDCHRNTSNRRKRRASFKQKRDKRSVPQTWTNGWNETSATEFCEAKFAASPTVQAVKNIPGVDVETFKWACVQDIENSGTTDFSDEAVAAVRDNAIRETLANRALNLTEYDYAYDYTDNYDHIYNDPDAPTMYDIINRMTCPADCNSRGTCHEGQCQCNACFGGTDCSVDLSVPPVIVEIGVEGHCDLGVEDCSRIDVFGNTFLDDKDVKCQLDISQVSMSGGLEESSQSITISEGDQQSLSKVTCQLPTINSHDVVLSINISVSQSDNIFSNILNILVYDSTCVILNHYTREWEIVNGHCTFRGKCYTPGSSKIEDTCWKCLSENGLPSWQRETDERCKPTAACGPIEPGIITLILGAGILFI